MASTSWRKALRDHESKEDKQGSGSLLESVLRATPSEAKQVLSKKYKENGSDDEKRKRKRLAKIKKRLRETISRLRAELADQESLFEEFYGEEAGEQSAVRVEARSEPSSESSRSAPTYLVEENSRGELWNKRYNVKWPTQVHGIKSYPHSSSSSSSIPPTPNTCAKTSRSPIDMAELLEYLGPAKPRRNKLAKKKHSRREKTRRDRKREKREDKDNRGRDRKAAEECDVEPGSTDVDCDSSSKVDSVVFNSDEEYTRATRCIEEHYKEEIDEMKAENRHFIGLYTRHAVEKMLKPGLFVAYYDAPPYLVDTMPDIDDFPLIMGCMSMMDQKAHFPIRSVYDCYNGHRFEAREAGVDKKFRTIDDLVTFFTEAERRRPAHRF